MMRVNGSSNVTVLLAAALACSAPPTEPTEWSPAELEELRSLWIGSLGAVPSDATNRVADDPRAAELGHRLFFDVRLSANGQVSCGTCHRPELQFQDGTPLARGIGPTDRRTMPIAGTAHSPWQFWDGRADSQWAQALGPLEHPMEHGTTRTQVIHVVAAHYREEYEALFGPVPHMTGLPENAGPTADLNAAAAWADLPAERREAVTRAFANVGKAIAAYERRIGYGSSRFDRYVEALLRDGRAQTGVLSPDEIAGLRLFIGRGNCTQCHNGPLLSNNDFHNTGVAAVTSLPADRGRAQGASQVLAHEFNCRSRWSDAPDRCSELDFIVADGHELERAFKTPSLRNVADRAPYMHAGQIASLAEVLAHYNAAPAAPAGHSELRPLRLSARELAQLEAYLRALTGPLAGEPRFLAPPR
jgi:cytochrome c peroxidase